MSKRRNNRPAPVRDDLSPPPVKPWPPSPPVVFKPGHEPHICRIGNDPAESERAAAALQRLREAAHGSA